MILSSILTDGGSRTDETRHYECRNCGQNLSAESTACPDCGGDVAVFTF
jgi:rRNA maturation endonuclease Nob1